MTETDDGVPLICSECVREPFLSGRVASEGHPARCSYCAGEDVAVSMDVFADWIEAAFRDHFTRTADEPSPLEDAIQRDRESDFSWEREGDPTATAIADAAGLELEPASDVQLLLEERHGDPHQDWGETEFGADVCYEPKRTDDAGLRESWMTLELELKTEARFFSRQALATLDNVFEGLGSLASRDGEAAIVGAGPGTALESLFRARVFQSDAALAAALESPERDVGPPPSSAAKAGRMSAGGISVFYGAASPETALGEVRPPVGSRVVTARFELIRPLRLLDLSALRRIFITGSIFDPSHIRRLERARFLDTLSQRMTAPVMPEAEPVDYLPTQAVADYLATDQELGVDGIVFPSVQSPGGGPNIVLFHKASLVDVPEPPGGLEVTVSLYSSDEDGDSPDFSVFEREVGEGGQAAEGSAAGGASRGRAVCKASTGRGRLPSLRLDRSSLQVHLIRSASYGKETFPVGRHRFRGECPDF